MHRARKLIKEVLGLNLLMLSCLSMACFAADDAAISRVKEKVARDQCRAVYWGGADAGLQGHTWPLRLVFEGDRFYARIKFRANHLPDHSDYWGVDDDHGTAIRGNYVKDFEAKIQNDAIETEVTIPVECTLHYDPETPEKQRMVETIRQSMLADLSRWREQGIRPYPEQVTLLVADFNVDDLYTYVLVMPQKDVLEVALHDPTWMDDPRYQRDGYISRDIVDNLQRHMLIPKIREHSITREVQLNDAGPSAPNVTPSASGARE